MQPDMERDEYEIPVTREHMGRTRKTCTAFNTEPSEHLIREHHPAYHQEQNAHDNANVNNRPHDSQSVVFSLEKALDPRSVLNDVNRPQNK